MLRFLIWSAATGGLAVAANNAPMAALAGWIIAAAGLATLDKHPWHQRTFFLLWPLFFVLVGLAEIFTDGPPDEPPTGTVFVGGEA